MDYKKRSVGVIITNPSRTKFYVQQKDEGYFVKEFRLKYCFFGGNIKKNEEEYSALIRELEEEFNKYFSDKLSVNIKKLFDTYFINILKDHYKHSLYESILDEEELIKLSLFKPNEGKRGVLVSRKEFMELDWFSDLIEAREKYLKDIN